ncbi:MAG: tyrosine-type recombinase/integrase, partial [Thermoplasmata archaeon]|nr:tyrosine-type recombinase/integrase [Candidatus Sysuiplasma superficiale]
GNALFTSPRGRMTYQYARKMIKDQATKAGIPWLHAHSLRHYCATTLAAADMNLKKVQIHLGHKSIRSTEVYANLRQSAASGEVASFFDARFRRQGAKKERFVPEGAIMDESEQLLRGGCGI